MTPKKLLITTGLVAALLGIIATVGTFYYQNLRGLGAALAPAPEDIAKVIAPSSTFQTPLQLPPGFVISIFAKGLGSPRVLTTGIDGTVWVSIPAQGKIVALPDRNGDGVAEEATPIVTGLNYPHGFVWRCTTTAACQLYVAETDKITVFDIDPQTLALQNKKTLISLPTGGNHTTRTILFLPTGDQTIPNQLLISIGSSCNVCHEANAQRATIQVLNVDTGELQPFAVGLRNSVFTAEHPTTHEIWATEMGRDLLGDNTPPDEINIIKKGKNYGWPNCYGQNIHDVAFDKNTYIRNPCMEPFETPSLIDIQAHSAPLGLAFVPNQGWPKGYSESLLVAYHGSWNRSVPTGYKVVRYPYNADGSYGPAEDFITGWLTTKYLALGRPAGLLFQSDGSLYISDDKAGVVYRVIYK